MVDEVMLAELVVLLVVTAELTDEVLLDEELLELVAGHWPSHDS